MSAGEDPDSLFTDERKEIVEVLKGGLDIEKQKRARLSDLQKRLSTDERKKIMEAVKSTMDNEKQKRAHLRDLLGRFCKKISAFQKIESPHQTTSNIFGAIQSIKEGHTPPLIYIYGFCCRNTILEWLVNIWNGLEEGRSMDELRLWMGYLEMELNMHAERFQKGKYELHPWGTKEQYEKAEKGPPSSER